MVGCDVQCGCKRQAWRYGWVLGIDGWANGLSRWVFSAGVGNGSSVGNGLGAVCRVGLRVLIPAVVRIGVGWLMLVIGVG